MQRKKETKEGRGKRGDAPRCYDGNVSHPKLRRRNCIRSLLPRISLQFVFDSPLSWGSFLTASVVQVEILVLALSRELVLGVRRSTRKRARVLIYVGRPRKLLLLVVRAVNV